MGGKEHIRLENYEGSIVPVLIDFLDTEITKLRNSGVELLELDGGKYLVYVKEYSAAEQLENLGNKNLAGKFHEGFTLYSFFSRFSEYSSLVDKKSLDDMLPFLSKEEVSVLTSNSPGI